MTHLAQISHIPTSRLISVNELSQLVTLNQRSIVSHPDFRTRVHSERPGWYVPYARGGGDHSQNEIRFANDRLKTTGNLELTLEESNDSQLNTSSERPDHPLSRQEARLQLRRAGKGRECSPSEHKTLNHDSDTTQVLSRPEITSKKGLIEKTPLNTDSPEPVTTGQSKTPAGS